MRIVSLEVFHADGGWRPYSFVKVVTDEGIVGWSEFAESSWSPQLGNVILALGETVKGEDPTRFASLSATLHAVTRFARGGINHQAISAIENACLDVAAKSHGLAICRLFGGPFRDSIEIYWSHCGTFRATHPKIFEQVLGVAPLRSLDDLRKLGREAAERGYRAVKTNPIVFGPDGPQVINPGFVRAGLDLAAGADARTIRAIRQQVTALRDGLGPDIALMLDCNFAFRADSLKRIVNAVADAHPKWLEIDLLNAVELNLLRAQSEVPVASLESLHECREYLPFFNVGAVDVAIIDVLWNGLPESVRIAQLAESFEINVAPHNFYGPLADLISAQFCAAASNVSVMEFEGDDVPWKYDLLTQPLTIADGSLVVPTGPGWGGDIDEDVLRAHPWNR